MKRNPEQDMVQSSETSSFSNDEIAARAYRLYDLDGRMDGRDMEYWFRAEAELKAEQEQKGRQQESRSNGKNRAGERGERAAVENRRN